MHPTTTENKVASSPPAEAPKQPLTLEERLERIDHNLTRIQEKAQQDEAKKALEKRKSSRSTVTLAFALLGLKIGGLIGSKVLVGKEGIKYFTQDRKARIAWELDQKMKELQDSVKQPWYAKPKILSFLRRKPDTNKVMLEFTKYSVHKLGEETSFLKRAAIDVGIAGAIGAVIGGILGWARGDRLNDPYELIKNPIEALKKMFGPAPKDHKPLDVVEEQHEKKIPNPSSHILPEKPKESPLTTQQPAAASKPWAHRMEDKQQELQEPALFPNR